MPATLITLFLGFIIGFAVAWAIKKPKPDISKKESGKEKIIQHIKQSQKITNDGVEELLGVGDTTAYNYLQELEDEGEIEQVGTTGKHVYYKIKF